MDIKIIVILTIFISLFFLEHIKPFRIYLYQKLRLIVNLSLWFINSSLSLLLILPMSELFSRYHLFQPLTQWWGLILHFLILDFSIYWWHRLNHQSKLLWKFHSLHHSDQHLDTTNALRFHFFEVFLSALFRMPIIIIFSIPFSHIIYFEALLMGAALFQHANIVLPKRFEKILSYFIVTPSIHWIHHHAKHSDTHSSYSLFLSIWDRVFRTSRKTKRTPNMPLGLEK